MLSWSAWALRARYVWNAILYSCPDTMLSSCSLSFSAIWNYLLNCYYSTYFGSKIIFCSWSTLLHHAFVWAQQPHVWLLLHKMCGDRKPLEHWIINQLQVLKKHASTLSNIYLDHCISNGGIITYCEKINLIQKLTGIHLLLYMYYFTNKINSYFQLEKSLLTQHRSHTYNNTYAQHVIIDLYHFIYLFILFFCKIAFQSIANKTDHKRACCARFMLLSKKQTSSIN